MTFSINDSFLSNARLIAILKDGSSMVFAKGKFDTWCIYQVCGRRANAIKDVDVFAMLARYTSTSERFTMYNDFLYVFDMVTKVVDYDLVDRIKFSSKKYSDPAETEYIFIFLYAGMIAEENKKNAILKKFIKRLGVHQVLIEKLAPVTAANYSRGKKWQELRQECQARGFYSCFNQAQLSA
ncbi:hypothetical protein GMES_4441 [Paraglaciecola mesophila KMM 241]|uniref:Uncharacterized protein n=1 Tax=Paraglaciecola mesophila KMM 241 TaxID=1128912 RepID=K6Z8J4_9ALTE|nr:hypothetical protein [Paraglaciecola mesophila]GAC26707.1 hypothetical protein GMES_4441 [Paraglaciecola mesophila KMM 241]